MKVFKKEQAGLCFQNKAKVTLNRSYQKALLKKESLDSLPLKKT